LFVCLLLLQGLNPNVNALFLLFALHFILLVGNIESNPGPHELSQSISENNHTDRCISLCNLEKMYLAYIRPLFEYACEVWNNCRIGYSYKLEKLQIDAARIVTGLPIFTKLEYLYAERSVKSKNNAFTFGFRPWSKRRQTNKREHRRLVLNMFK
jgi:hypothetical protein